MKKKSFTLLLIISGLCFMEVQGQLPGMGTLRKLKNKKEEKTVAEEKKPATIAPNIVTNTVAVVENKKIADEGVTGPLHEKFMGKIVFSGSEIPKTGANEAQIASELKAANPVYFRMYLKESIYNNLIPKFGFDNLSRFTEDVKLYYKIYLDGSLVSEGFMVIREYYRNERYITEKQKESSTTFDGAFDFKSRKLGSNEYQRAIKAADAAFGLGKHTLKMEIYPYFEFSPEPNATRMGGLIASGEINLVVEKGFVDPADPEKCLPKAGKKDPALEKSALESILKNRQVNNLEGEVKKMVIVDEDWRINKSSLGLILSRSMFVVVGIKENGKCKGEWYKIWQEWNGTAYQGKINTQWEKSYSGIFCDCLK